VARVPASVAGTVGRRAACGGAYRASAAAGREGENWSSGAGHRRHRGDTCRENCAAAAGAARGRKWGRLLLGRLGPLATATDGGGGGGGSLDRGNMCGGENDRGSIRGKRRRGQRGRGALRERRRLTVAGAITVAGAAVVEAAGVSASDSGGAGAADGGWCGGCGAGRQ